MDNTGIAKFIEKHYVGEEICIFYGEDAETITYNQSWVANKEYMQGVVRVVENNTVVLYIEDVGDICINSDSIVSFWKPGFSYSKAVKTSLKNNK
jgi:hypothetical protein